MKNNDNSAACVLLSSKIASTMHQKENMAHKKSEVSFLRSVINVAKCNAAKIREIKSLCKSFEKILFS